MGAVYKARQTSLGRLVALKTLQAGLADDSEYIERFRQEARAAAGLMHPNLVQVYSAGENDGLYWFAMEYVEGESARARLKRKGRIEPLEAIAIAIHVATALEYGWRKAQLIHRDIKPDNIFLSSDGEVKLGDLGLAKSAGQTTGLTVTGHSMGSRHYISPEQVQDMKVVDFRADIYSLGCTLFHMISGKPPFDGSNSTAIMLKHITEPVPILKQAWPDCSQVLSDVVEKMMQKDSSDRHQDYETVMNVLRAAYKVESRHDEPTLVVPERQPVATTKATSQPQVAAILLPKVVAVESPAAARKSKLPAYLGMAAAVIVILGMCVFLFRSKREKLSQPQSAVPKQASKTNPILPVANDLDFLPPGPPGPVKTYNIVNVGEAAFVQQDRRLLLTAGLEDEFRVSVRLLDLRTDKTVWQERYDVGERVGILSRTNQAILLGRHDGLEAVKINLDNGKKVDAWNIAHESWNSDCAIGVSPDEHYYAALIATRLADSGPYPCTVWLFETESFRPIATWNLELKGKPASLAWLDATHFLLGYSDSRAPALQFDTRFLNQPPIPYSPPLTFFVATDNSAKRLAANSPDGNTLLMIDYGNAKKSSTICELFHPRRICFSSASLAATNVENNRLLIYDLRKRRIENDIKLEHEEDRITLSADGRFGVLRGWFIASDGKQRPKASLWRLEDIVAPNSKIDDLSASKDAPFVNSLGMNFVPVPGTKVLFSIWDTRVQDYASYATANKVDDSWTKQEKDGVPVSREPDYPVVGVSWEDAQGFNQWLTKKESSEGKIPKGAMYRLPTDEEWSVAVGLPSEQGSTPNEKSGKNNVDYPWGIGFPPSKPNVGNYADDTFHTRFMLKDGWMAGYSDGYAATSSVATFPPNSFGLFDMGGNVWQWCEGWFDEAHKDRVLRGASWLNFERDYLLSSHRIHSPPSIRRNYNGFRCVLELPPK
jgi:serine/threonine-protein kinase